MKEKITSKLVLNLLLKKHEKDICIPECKTGPTWFAKKLFIMDLLVITRSWSNQHTYCYEIKINRSDFLNDNKWKEYLKYCTDFYFVCPKGIIFPEELPNDVGLLFTSKNCKKLFTKRLAVTRNISIPNDLYKYILMWRSIQKNEKEIYSKKYFWEQWLKNKKVNHEFGNNVSKSIRNKINDEIINIKDENLLIKIENENLRPIKNLLIELGINEEQIKSKYSNLQYKIKSKFKEIENSSVGNIHEYIDKIIQDLTNIKNIFNNMIK